MISVIQIAANFCNAISQYNKKIGDEDYPLDWRIRSLPARSAARTIVEVTKVGPLSGDDLRFLMESAELSRAESTTIGKMGEFIATFYA